MQKITFDFKSRTAIVTGGAQGFGLDITKRFLKSGAKVIIWDNDPKAIETAVKDLDNPNLSSNVVDVSNYDEVDKNVKQIKLFRRICFKPNPTWQSNNFYIQRGYIIYIGLECMRIL